MYFTVTGVGVMLRGRVMFINLVEKWPELPQVWRSAEISKRESSVGISTARMEIDHSSGRVNGASVRLVRL